MAKTCVGCPELVEDEARLIGTTIVTYYICREHDGVEDEQIGNEAVTLYLLTKCGKEKEAL